MVVCAKRKMEEMTTYRVKKPFIKHISVDHLLSQVGPWEVDDGNSMHSAPCGVLLASAPVEGVKGSRARPGKGRS